jgi:hypothetical protein
VPVSTSKSPTARTSPSYHADASCISLLSSQDLVGHRDVRRRFLASTDRSGSHHHLLEGPDRGGCRFDAPLAFVGELGLKDPSVSGVGVALDQAFALGVASTPFIAWGIVSTGGRPRLRKRARPPGQDDAI